MTYPSGFVLTYNYASGLHSNISRLTALSDASGTVESYDYLGLGTVVRRAHPLPGHDLTYIKQGAEPNGDAGDQYTGLDRFGRVVDQRWLKSGTATDRFEYSYDRLGNRTEKNNAIYSNFDEVYSYDAWNRVKVVKDSGGATLKTYTYAALNRQCEKLLAVPPRRIFIPVNGRS